MERQLGAERRSEPRYQVSHKFVVSHPQLGEVACLSEDLSLNGVFLVGDFSGVAVGTTVEISFVRKSRRQDVNKGTRYRFAAVITRITEIGAGLRFSGLTTEIDAALYDLMHRGA